MDVKEIVQSIDILEYISQYTDMELRNGEWWGLSPLKNEKTPSFSVREESQTWFDFSSGRGGNLIEFVKLYNHCDLCRALYILTEYAGVSPDGITETPKRLASTSIAKKYRKKESQKKCSQNSAKVLSQTCMDSYEKGSKMLDIWRNEGISDEALELYDVRFDPFDNRLVLPIRDRSGKIVNICGRTTDPMYKEKKLRKYTYYRGWDDGMSVIHGLYENYDSIKQSGEIILFEGIKSVMKAYGWGIKNTGAILTSHLNPGQFKNIIKLGVDVVFALDADVDIRTDRNIQRLTPYAKVYWVKNQDGILEEKDSPVDKGEEVFRKLYERKVRIR